MWSDAHDFLVIHSAHDPTLTGIAFGIIEGFHGQVKHHLIVVLVKENGVFRGVPQIGDDGKGNGKPKIQNRSQMIHGMPTRRERFAKAAGLQPLRSEAADRLSLSSAAGIAEVLLPPRSQLIGSSLRKSSFLESKSASISLSASFTNFPENG